MPLLQGQPFKLITPPNAYPVDSEIYTIQHTGEKFLNKSDYEDRLALYSQSIWTCQCTGHTGLTHKEAWMSEAKVRMAAKSAVPVALQKPLLSLVHHSLSPLEQLIDAASILCHSQYHVGEELLLLYPKQIQVRVVTSKEVSKGSQALANGLPSEKEKISLLNGNANGISKGDSPGTSPGKENQAKEATQPPKDDASNKKEMLPKLYDVITLEEEKFIENVFTKNLLRPYKIPSKDQLRLFIRSCALRHRGSTCTPWVVSDDFVKAFNIPNKLPSLFLSSPKPNQSSSKRKAQGPYGEIAKRPKSDPPNNKAKKENLTKVPPLVIKSDNSNAENKPSLVDKVDKMDKTTDRLKFSMKGNSQNSSSSGSLSKFSKSVWGSVTKHPLSLGKPKLLPRPPQMPGVKSSLPVSKGGIPRKRGRPPLSQEEKERNKKMRQATLLDLSNKMGVNKVDSPLNIIKVKTACSDSLPNQSSSSYLHPSNPLLTSPYKSPVKRANTPEMIMKLPFMRRFVHEFKTIKGVLGQFRRYAHTMDLVLAKLSSMQIEMIPDELLRQDLLTRQKKVQDKKFFEKLTPDERKTYLKDKARTVALERWKERKLKNLKIEDQTIPDLKPLPSPKLVEISAMFPNDLFGDVVMVTDFITCFSGLLVGEEKFRTPSEHIMAAISAGPLGYSVLGDIICCLLPAIIHDDISKNCKEIGALISGIPITYQTAHELTRLCLRKADEDESSAVVVSSEENYQLGREEAELSDELLEKLEHYELWDLNCHEVVAVLKALVHKALCTASISVYVEEMEEKVLQTLRERRKFMKQIHKDQKAEMEKRKEERMMNKINKGVVPKKQRGRPKGYSPKIGAINLQKYFPVKEDPSVSSPSVSSSASSSAEKPKEGESICSTVHKRKLSVEAVRKEKAELQRLDKERQKQLEEDQKRQAMVRKYDDVVFKRDNLLRRTPIGFDRDHNRYWIFNTKTPGLYVEKGWVDDSTEYKYSLQSPNKGSWSNACSPMCTPVKVKSEPGGGSDAQCFSSPSASVSASGHSNSDEDERPLSIVVKEEEEKPLSVLQSDLQKDINVEDNRTLSKVKSKLTISPMKMTYRGRPPKEAYVLVDEDTQTFPTVGKNTWYRYKSMSEISELLSCLSDKGQRESQLIAAININKDRLQYHYNKKIDPLKLATDSSVLLKESLKDDICQIERELIEGWLGGVPNFEEWEKKVREAEDVCTMGVFLMDAQRHMQIKYLKSIMTPAREPVVNGDAETGAPTEYVDVEGPGVDRWREAVTECKTYSRLHVLVGLFDSCIRWEKSMATRKCKVCRSKVKEDPLVMCAKCETNYHWYCLRPALKEDPGERWVCPACVPKKTRREESSAVEPESVAEEQDEKDDPTFSLERSSSKRSCKGRTKKQMGGGGKAVKECVVCLGRIGLISCSKCATAYHSECHDPPLMSRARKDWVCGSCLNPKKAGRPKANKGVKAYGGEEGKPFVRRNYFGNIEELSYKTCVGNRGPRDTHGRFLRGVTARKCAAEGDAVRLRMEEEEGEVDVEGEGEMEEEEEERVNKFGRTVRGAKMKALDSITKFKNKSKKDSRRSCRNETRRKNYKDESENEKESDDESGSGSEDDDSEGEEGNGKREANVKGSDDESESEESEDESEKEGSDEEENDESENDEARNKEAGDGIRVEQRKGEEELGSGSESQSGSESGSESESESGSRSVREGNAGEANGKSDEESSSLDEDDDDDDESVGGHFVIDERTKVTEVDEDDDDDDDDEDDDGDDESDE